MSNHFVSVIIPNYNHVAFLKQRITSVLNQTFQDFEIIILDDCSTDYSKHVVEQYRNHPKVSQIVFNEQNSGSPFKQWKKGIELAKGNLIWIAESDDYADANFLQTAINSLSNCQNAVLFSSASSIVDENNGKRENPLAIDLRTGCYNGTEIIRQFLVDRNRIVNASACVFKKEEAIKHIEQIIDFKLVGDWLFWIALLSNGNLAYSDKKLNYFRDTPFSTRQHHNWQKKLTRLTEELKVLEFLFQNKIIPEETLNKRLESVKNRLCWSLPSFLSVFKLKEEKLNYNGFSLSKQEIIRQCIKLKMRSIKNKISGKSIR